MVSASSKVTWIFRLLQELGVPIQRPITLYCDNQSAIFIGKNPIFYERTKHIEIDCHFTRDKVFEGLLQFKGLFANKRPHCRFVYKNASL